MLKPLAPSLSVLKKRSDYLSVAARRQRWVTPAFILQVAPLIIFSESQRYGLTASKKMVGKQAVLRNRARRRLRALAKEFLPPHAKTGVDYVFIARQDALTRPYEKMKKDLEKALRRLDLWCERT